MKRSYSSISVASAIVLLAGCSSLPEQIPELDTAKAAVQKVESSSRVGVAATDASEARKALDRANAMVEKGGDLEDIQHEANVATARAQVADTKIDTALAREEIEKGTAERQQVVLEARNREAQLARENAERMQKELKDMQAKQTERGMVLTLGDVLFDTGKSTLKPGAHATMDKLAHVLNTSKGNRVTIEGHTDSMGSDANNQVLSEQRALAVQAALMQRGVSGSQIMSVGKGESTPVAGNDSASGRQANRRVELIFSQEAGRVASDGD
jgi:outer membrane protein OmpA-like peptidoglycan-associated protein